RSRLNVALSRGPGAVHTLDGATISTTSCLAHGHPPLTCAGRVSQASLALNDPRVGVDPGAALPTNGPRVRAARRKLTDRDHRISPRRRPRPAGGPVRGTLPRIGRPLRPAGGRNHDGIDGAEHLR